MSRMNLILGSMMVAVTHATVTLETGTWAEVSNLVETELPTSVASSCGASDLFKFGVYKGTDPSKVIFEFQGGGFCFNPTTCFDEDDPTCSRNQIDDDDLTTFFAGDVRNHEDERNPLREWSHIYIPYCTCDFHWGNRDIDYNATGQLFGGFSEADPENSSEVTFKHRGYANFLFVMEWFKENLAQFEIDEAPTELFMTGCSAGGYGVSVLQDKIMDLYPTSKPYTFVDSAFGTLSWLPMNLWTNFTRETAYTELVSSALNLEESEFFLESRSISTVQQTVADAHPRQESALFAFRNDPVIGDDEGLVDTVVTNDEAKRCNYRTWIKEGEFHCTLPFSIFTQEVEGEPLVDKITKLLDPEVCISSTVPPLEGYSEAGNYNLCIDSACAAEDGEKPGATAWNTGVGIFVTVFVLGSLFLLARNIKTSPPGEPDSIESKA